MARERLDFDQALKNLLLQGHDGFLALVAPGLTWRGERSAELPAIARRADILWEVLHANRRGLAHIELRLKADASIGERVAEYGIRLWRRDHLPVYSIVVYLRLGRRVPASPFVIDWMGQERLRYHYTVVKLWELPAHRVLATPHATLWPLAALMGTPATRGVDEAAERIAESRLPRRRQIERTGLLGLLAGIRLNHATIIATLRRPPMIEGLARESSMARYFEEEGMAKGLAEGRVEGLRTGLLLALEGQFGDLDAALRAAVMTADGSVLEDLLSRLATASPHQIRERLGLE